MLLPASGIWPPEQQYVETFHHLEQCSDGNPFGDAAARDTEG